MGYWIPATWISHMIDASIFGLDAGGHHLVNVALHAAATALLFLALQRLTGATVRSVLAAALFGAHPLRVESVAWVAERKDVLSALFFVLTLFARERYVRNPKVGRYLAALLAFTAGLLAKPMLVTLPIVLLLLDHWPLGRAAHRAAPPHPAAVPAIPWRLLVFEKAPFLLLAAAASAITIFTKHQSGIMKDFEQFSPATRIANALLAPAGYLGKTLWPVQLGIFYPHPGPGLAAWKVAGAAALIAAITIIAIRLGGRRPYLATGWFWYLAVLLPVLGFFQAGLQAAADRFTYLPHAGLFVAAVWFARDVAPSKGAVRSALIASTGALVLLLAARAAVQTGYWRDSVTLFERNRAVAGDSWLISNNLGIAYLDEGRAEEAAGAFREAVRFGPENAGARLNLGAALGRAGLMDEAITHLAEAVRLLPGSAAALFNLGLAHEIRGRHGEALSHLREAARLAPADDEARRAIERVAASGGEPLRQGR